MYFIIYSPAAGLALLDVPNVSAEDIVRKAMKIAGDKCCFTNHTIRLETLKAKEEGSKVVVPPPALSSEPSSP